MFKRKTQKFYNHSKNDNYSQNLNNEAIMKTINIPSQYSYILNISEPIFVKPYYNKMAFLMTPCYILDKDDIIYRNIDEYENKKCINKSMNKYNLTSRHKQQSLRQKSEIYDMDNIYDKIFNKDMKNYSKTRKNNNFKKIFFPSNKNDINSNSKNKNYKNPRNNKNDINELKRPISTDRIKYKNKNRFLFDDNIQDVEPLINRNMTSLYLLANKNSNINSKNKKIKKNKNLNSDSNVFDDINSLIPGKKSNKNKYNREIFSNLYQNNNLNNLRKLDYKKINNEKNNKKRNVLWINTERMQNKKYKIFEQGENQRNNKIINDSHDYILHHSINNSRKSPYNKILSKNSLEKNRNILQKETKKILKSSSMSNYLNNSNTQSNNPNLKNISTNYSIGPVQCSNYQGNKKSKKTMKTKNLKDENNNIKNKNVKNNKKRTSWNIELGQGDECFKDSSEKNSNFSNRISLQSINDSKIMEMAGYYGHDDSSSDNYQMNNIIHAKKKQFLKRK